VTKFNKYLQTHPKNFWNTKCDKIPLFLFQIFANFLLLKKKHLISLHFKMFCAFKIHIEKTHNFVVRPGSTSSLIFYQYSKMIFPLKSLRDKEIDRENSQGRIKKSSLTYTSQKIISLIVVANLLILKKNRFRKRFSTHLLINFFIWKIGSAKVRSAPSLKQFLRFLREWQFFWKKEKVQQRFRKQLLQNIKTVSKRMRISGKKRGGSAKVQQAPSHHFFIWKK